MTLPFAVRLRAHAAGLEELAGRVAAGSRDPSDLLALAEAPLPLLAALAGRLAPRAAAVVGLLPVRPGPDVATTVERALAHRAAAEAEVAELSCAAPCATGALDQACETMVRLARALPGLDGRIDEASLHALAAGAGIDPEGAAARLQRAGVSLVSASREPGALRLVGAAEPGAAGRVGPLPIRETWIVPPRIGEGFVRALLGAPRALFLRAGEDTTGVQVLRAVALARLSGHGPIAAGGEAELKGPDAALAFGADVLEAELDPPGALGSRTRAYGEAAVRGAQLALVPPRRRAPAGAKAAHILDEQVDASLLPGGAPAPEVNR